MFNVISIQVSRGSTVLSEELLMLCTLQIGTVTSKFSIDINAVDDYYSDYFGDYKLC